MASVKTSDPEGRTMSPTAVSSAAPENKPNTKVHPSRRKTLRITSANFISPSQSRGYVGRPGSFSNRAFAVTDPVAIHFGAPKAQVAELPPSNGIGTVSPLPRTHTVLIGEVDGVRPPTPETSASGLTCF